MSLYLKQSPIVFSSLSTYSPIRLWRIGVDDTHPTEQLRVKDCREATLRQSHGDFVLRQHFQDLSRTCKHCCLTESPPRV